MYEFLEKHRVHNSLPQGFTVKKKENCYVIQYFRWLSPMLIRVLIIWIGIFFITMTLISDSIRKSEEKIPEMEKEVEFYKSTHQYLKLNKPIYPSAPHDDFGLSNDSFRMSRNDYEREAAKEYIKRTESAISQLMISRNKMMVAKEYLIKFFIAFIVLFLILYYCFMRKKILLYPDKIIYKRLFVKKEIPLDNAFVAIKKWGRTNANGEKITDFFDLIVCHHWIKDKLFTSDNETESNTFSEIMNEWIQSYEHKLKQET